MRRLFAPAEKHIEDVVVVEIRDVDTAKPKLRLAGERQLTLRPLAAATLHNLDWRCMEVTGRIVRVWEGDKA